MAYNLQSLINILQQLLNPEQTRWIFDQNKHNLQYLLKEAESLQQILENSSLTKIGSLESRIRTAAYKAEDIIESNMVKQMLSNPEAMSFTLSTPDIDKVEDKLSDVMDEVEELIKKRTMSSGSSSSGLSFSHDLSSKSIVEDDPVQSKAVVGVNEDLRQLKDRVMEMQSKLEIVPIVGMGGIGKTTLARKLFQDRAVVEHFTCHAWATVSQYYNMQAILLSLLRCIIGKESDQHMEKGADELKDILYKSLFGRRYMIVLDDIWSVKFWDEIRMYLPDSNKGSRIVITTRELDVAKHANSRGKQHEMQLLDELESWNLLRQEVFGDEEDCPDALEMIGRNIARNCGGLPLAICVIGGLLSSKANTTQGFWENVANDIRAAIAESDGEFSDILSLSYNHLPSHLKPCFLYMGAFPEDYEFKASRLIRLWAAEGFLKSKGEKSFEEEAEDCLKALVDRNLISVRAFKSDGRAKTYGMHDLMRDLCLKKAKENRFVNVGEKQGGAIRRVSIHPSYLDLNLFYDRVAMCLSRSFLCTAPTRCRIQPRVLSALRLVRVLDLLNIRFRQFPTEILQSLNLRFLALTFTLGQLPLDISRLRNLQTLVLSRGMLGQSISLPSEILQMAELRHVVVYNASFFFASRFGRDWNGFILDKLQTFFSISSNHRFLHRIPNVKSLGIEDESSKFDLSHLHKLETLRFSRGYNPVLISSSVLTLPPSLKKLSLTKCKLVGGFMNYLSELPNFEVLKLHRCEFEGGEWDAMEQEFSRLKFLLLDRVKLVKWEADEANFPRLHHLVIRYCNDLEEIPSGIGEISSLQTIELSECSPSVVVSAKLIIKEQRESGNEDLRLHI